MYTTNFLQENPTSITIEDCMSALGANKTLSDKNLEKACLIKDINKLAISVSLARGGRGTPITPKEFDALYDMNIEELGNVLATITDVYHRILY